MRRAKRRKKVSTTISPESYAFLRELIRSGRAENLAQALDLVLEEIRRADNRRRLEQATAKYYDELTPEQIAEENELGGHMSQLSSEVLFDE
jgi:hypothetical protein